MTRRPVREPAAPARPPDSAVPTAEATVPAAGDEPTGAGRAARPARSGRVRSDRAGGTEAAGGVTVDGRAARGPNDPVDPLRGLVTVSGRLVLTAPRRRGIPSIDVVDFIAPCPACGKDVSWIEEREETRLRIIIECPCDR